MKKRYSGFTLIELIGSLVIISIVLVLVNGMLDDTNTERNKTQTARQMTVVGDAAKRYIRDNYSAIAGIATASQPALIRASTLASTKYLETGYTGMNAYNQNMCVLVLQPTTGQLIGIVVAEGGRTINDLDLGSVASQIKGEGGGVYSDAPTTFIGARGSWKVPVDNFANSNQLGLRCDGSTGTVAIAPGHPVMALWFSNGDPTGGALMRNSIPGQPTMNQMNTPLVMNSVQTVNASCTTVGAIARESSGNIVVCQGGQWKSPSAASFWKDPAATFGALPSTSNSVGDVRMTVDTGRAFMWTGGGWVALAVDQNGNLTVPGTFSAAGGKVFAWNNVSEGGVLQLVGANGLNMYLENNNGNFRVVNSPWNREIFRLDQSGNLYASGTIEAPFLLPDAVVQAGWACNVQNGTIAKDSSGVIYSCQSGVWRNASLGTGNSGLFKTHIGESIGCSIGGVGALTFQVTIDSAGNLIEHASGYWIDAWYSNQTYINLGYVTYNSDSATTVTVTATGLEVHGTERQCNVWDQCADKQPIGCAASFNW